MLDTTVQPKAIAHPTDSRLLNRAREQLVDAAKDADIELRQSYARAGKHADHKAGRYAHARQFQRMRREIRKLRTWLGRVIRDVERKAQAKPETLKAKLQIARRLHAQRREDKNNLYALHAPEVECLAKGKVRTPYEFGVKVSVAMTAKEGLVVGPRSMPGNPLRRAYRGQSARAGRDPDRGATEDRAGRPRLSENRYLRQGVARVRLPEVQGLASVGAAVLPA